MKLYGRTDKAIIEMVRICRERDLLRDFLDAHEKEGYNAMQLFTEEFVDRAMKKEAYKDGGLNMLFGLVRDKILTPQIAADRANLSLSEFNAMMADYDEDL